MKNFFFLVPIAILLVIQIPHLSLPYFWDEAWSYIPAIRKMAETGPSMLPGVIPIDYCKGHPQFFFFLSSIWMDLSPDSILFMRILPLLISIGVLLVTFFELRKFAGIETANIAILLIGVQSTFLAQSIFILPEMLLTLLLIVSLFAFLNRRYLIFAISSSLMVLTKETAIVFTLTFGLYYLISILSKRGKDTFYLGHFILLIVPEVIYGMFLLLHYLKFGVFFYADHLSLINLSSTSILEKIGRVMVMVFSQYGRMLLSLLILITLGLLIILKKKIQNRNILILCGLSIVIFMIFTSINSYSPRYTLGIIIMLVIVFSVIFSQLPVHPYLRTGVVAIIASICLYYSLTHKRSIDTDLGYVEVIRVHQEMVRYCEDNNLYDEPISASFNMYYNLHNNELGYITSNREFTHIMDWGKYNDAKYLIFESTFNDSDSIIQLAKIKYRLVRTFTNKHAWGYIYENTNYQESTAIKNNRKVF
ncbi:MAG: glycosyltransferase family 39 protein [Bacteroidota bacterium]|nr:glycosyltransferase family 39 protein [Bacteroidota bacterium]